MADGRYRLDSGSWVDFDLTVGEFEVPSVDANLVEVVPFGTLVSEAAVDATILEWGAYVARTETGTQTTHTYPVTFVSGDIGKTVVFAAGPNQHASAATVNGNAATKISTDAGTLGQRVTVFSYAVQAGDVGTINIVLTTGSVANEDQMRFAYMLAASGATVSATTEHSVVNTGTLDPITDAITPTGAGSSIGAFVFGYDEYFTPDPVWSAPAVQPTGGAVTGTQASGRVAIAEDQPASAVTITLTPDAGATTARAGMRLFTVAPA